MINTDEIYTRLIEIANEKGKLLKEADYDFDRLEEDGKYLELEQEERNLMLQIKRVEYKEIIDNSYLFAYDRFLENRKKED